MIARLKHLFPPALTFCLGSAVSWTAILAEEDDSFFEKQIRPLLHNRCLECHTSTNPSGGLDLSSKNGWEKGGDSGQVIAPGDLKGSSLLTALRETDHPPVALSKAETDDIEFWIQMGAPGPREGNRHWDDLPNSGRSRAYWSFQPVRKPETPQVRDEAWPESGIDAFIRSAQEAENLDPARDATPLQLVRRLYFSLTGLPPTPEQIEAYLGDNRPDAYERLVDSLLASPHFGERWGRHWLDVARFAESSGGGRTLLFKDAWRYRDYVIQAFNADMPYDQMVREQIAGDLLPYANATQRNRQLTATAFLALGPTNYELQDKQLLRYDVIDEQIDTVGKAFLGMTMGCVRCHDHKFDPIPSEDYYALAGIFKSTRTLFNYTDNVARWVDTPLMLEGEAAEKMARSEAIEAKITPVLNARKAELAVLNQHASKPPESGLPKPARLIPGIVLDESQAEAQGAWMFSQYSQNYLGEGYLHDGNRNKGVKSLTFRTTIPVTGRYEVRLAYAEAPNRATNTPVTVRHANGNNRILVNQQNPPHHYGRFHSLGSYDYTKGDEAWVRITTEDTNGHVLADAVQWFLLEDKATAQSAGRKEHLADLKNEIKQLEKELKPVTAHLKSRPLAMTVKDDPRPSDSSIRIRGVESQKGKVVPRGFIQVATPGDAPEIPEDQSGRLQLAEWIVSPDNPLTARVMANRVWSWLFGAGIVRSVDNVGTTGELPSHPELLDYLAVRLRELDWSIKSLVREIVLSRTWRLTTDPPSNTTKADPDNRLFTHYPLRRLDAEQLRDAILAANGNLDLTLYGPNIEGAGEINANSTDAQNTEYNYVFKDKRRSVYTPAFRVRRHELFELFDFGNINFSMGRRNVSTVALQALYLLNNPFVLEQSRKAAEHLLDRVSNPEERVELAFHSTLGRPPSKAEKGLVEEFLKNGQSEDAVEEWTSIYQSLFGSIDFRYLK